VKWQIAIQDKTGKVRKIPLDHEYKTEKEAESEAENIATEEYTENDEAWGLEPLNDCRHWGENRADEYYFDVGCVIGHSWCDPAKCPDYEKTSQ